MKKIFRMTESDLKSLINESIKRVLRESILGDNFKQSQEDEIRREDGLNNNYQGFKSQKDYHDASIIGDPELDNTKWDDNDDIEN